MARRVFYSFHYKPDNWRAAKVRDIGVVEGNTPVSDNDWETVTRGGDPAIKKWIANQLSGRSCTIVLIGENTAGRKWIKYEIKKSWDDRKGVLGIYIHNLTDRNEKQSKKGRNPFDDVTVGQDERKLSSIVNAYDPTRLTSPSVYHYISDNLNNWVESAIDIRTNYLK